MCDVLCRSRLKHGRHFTFKSVYNDSAITLVPVSVVGAFVTEEQPFASQGLWLQVSAGNTSKVLIKF